MNLDQDTVRKLRGLIVFTVAAVVVGINYRSLFGLAGTLFGMAFPFLLGAALAFILNVPMRRVERSIRPGKKCRWRRIVSLLLTFLFVIGIIALVVMVVVPEMFRTVMSLQNSVPAFLDRARIDLTDWFARYPEIVTYINQNQVNWNDVMQKLAGFLSTGAGSLLSSTFSAAMSIVSGVAMFGIALVFAVYILLQKETLGRQMKKLIAACLPQQTADKLFWTAKLAEKTFSNFLAGQCVEAVILGTMFFVTLTILRMPYAVLIGVLIAFTALIPIFGSFIGCVVGAFLMFMAEPIQALIFVVVFLILQQIEGNLIYPHVVGNSVGLPSIWVLVAVTLGGSMMGIVGMLVFIPLTSVLYTLLREWVHWRLQKKKITIS